MEEAVSLLVGPGKMFKLKVFECNNLIYFWKVKPII